ncbi:putative centromere protein S [Ixodes scapularis]|uniref:Centromere protein S n=1 Tax=Ixodes scapularis TaxID=6945 RepID=B7PXV9_IXOSC|nr:centromere protein S, putative [Ixodes scapularis]|eukprot:XP_002401961.1 centromere protein S, putative [Ixodes scapularis]
MSREDRLSREMCLKAAVHYTVGQITEAVGQAEGTVVGRPVVAALTELVWKHAARTAADLEALAKHAKRATVSVDDVLLSARHNATLHRYMQAQVPEKVATKRKQV